MNTDQEKKSAEYWKQRGMIVGMLLGVALGLPIGIAMGNIAVGIGIGAGMGVSLGVAFGEGLLRKHSVESDAEVRPPSPRVYVILALVGLLVFLGVLLAFFTLR